MARTSHSGLSRFTSATAAAARRTGAHAPLPRERTFGTEQVLVSKSDLQGVITYANATLAGITGYRREELEGQPHSIVRHPHFPGGMFELMWQRIQAGQEIWAFVKNLAKDGSFYWALAQVIPTFNATGDLVGYHSVRRAPEPQAVREITPYYDLMIEVERTITHKPQAAAASLQMLHDTLSAEGTTYEEFVWDVIDRTGQEW